MLFLVVALPLNMLLLGLFLWYTSMRPRQFAASLLGTGAAAALAVALALLHYQHIVSAGCWVGWVRPLHCWAWCLGAAADGSAPAPCPAFLPLSWPQAHRGFMGRSLVPGCAGSGCPPGSEPNCNFPPTLPLIDLLPAGAQASRCAAAPPAHVHALLLALPHSHTHKLVRTSPLCKAQPRRCRAPLHVCRTSGPAASSAR